MPSQYDFANLDQLRLSDHGDAIERFYWPVVSKPLSEYEVFWKKFIVLLTNRVDSSAGSNWITLRRGLTKDYESILMSNYTAFYHCVVAHGQIEIGKESRADRGFNHPELFFFSAKACLDRLTALRAQAGEFLSRKSATIRLIIPKPCDINKRKSRENMVRAIGSYRGVFTHRNHLGRGTKQGRNLIPRLEHLPKSKGDPDLLWSDTMTLDEAEMTDVLDYQSTLWAELAAYLQDTWRGLADAFVQFRVDPAFIRESGLAPFLPIYSGIASQAQPNVTNPIAASGTMSL